MMNELLMLQILLGEFHSKLNLLKDLAGVSRCCYLQGYYRTA
jgi:hypothetical protein